MASIRFRKTFRLILINVGVLLGLIVLLEFVCSFFAFRMLPARDADPVFNHVWPQNGSRVHDEWVARNPEFPKPYTHVYNRQGWLERYDVAREKPPESFRIFYVGDSFTEGTLPMEESVPSRVEDSLNSVAMHTGKKIEIINTGTSSYSPILYYILIRRRILEYQPDLIVVNIDMTDDYDDWKYAWTAEYDAAGNPIAAPLRDISSTFIDTENGARRLTLRDRCMFFLARYSYTFNLIMALRRQPVTESARTASQPDSADFLYRRFAWCQYDWDTLTRTNVHKTLDYIRRIAGLCRSHSVKLMITSVPHYWQYAGKKDGSGLPKWSIKPHETIRDLAHDCGVPYLDSYAALKPFISGTPQQRYYYNDDMHFNPRGYALWARCHIAFLMDPANDLLPRSILQAR